MGIVDLISGWTLLLLFCCDVCSALAALPPDQAAILEHARISKDVINLADNATEINPLTETICPMRQLDPHGNPLAKLFRRQAPACWTASDGEAKFCSPNRCCLDPNDQNNGWCCGTAVACGGYSGSDYCTVPMATVTSTTTTTQDTTVMSTEYTTIADSTVWTTITSTDITVVTKSDVQTQTEVVWVTVAPSAAKRRNVREQQILTAATALGARLHIPASTVQPDTSLTSSIQHVPQAKITSPTQNHFRAFFRRQLSTSTVTSWDTITEYVTAGGVYTSTINETPTSTSTIVITSTFTSAPNAQTTIKVTSTITAGSGNEISPTGAAGGTTTSNTKPGGPGRGSKGLSTGAKAGIGVGAAIGAIIFGLLLSFLWRRHRKNKKAEVTEMINAAVAAATGAKDGGSAQKPPNTYVGTVPSPPPQSERYSDMMPVYDHRGSPVPIYQPQAQHPYPLASGSPGHEMSAVPATPAQRMDIQPMYYGEQNAPELYHPPAEMHHPVPVEAPYAYSPRAENTRMHAY